MRLRFVPPPGRMPRFPKRGQGDYPYVGRRYNAETRNHEPTEAPAEVVPDGDEARRLIELCKRDGDLLPFDAETARAIGVPFVPLTREGDGWVPAKPPAKPSASRKADD